MTPPLTASPFRSQFRDAWFKTPARKIRLDHDVYFAVLQAVEASRREAARSDVLPVADPTPRDAQRVRDARFRGYLLIVDGVPTYLQPRDAAVIAAFISGCCELTETRRGKNVVAHLRRRKS